jgi:hypothetical protein
VFSIKAVTKCYYGTGNYKFSHHSLTWWVHYGMKREKIIVTQDTVTQDSFIFKDMPQRTFQKTDRHLEPLLREL